MFVCEVGHVTERNVPMIKVVTAKRERTYSDGGIGWEVAHEAKLCPEHAAELSSAQSG
jgi:hypothetical protein